MTVFHIVFRGKIAEGFQPDAVKQKMAQLFKVDAARVEAMFTGKPVILRKNCDEETARKLKTVLGKAGAIIEVHPVQATAKPAEQAPKKPNPFLNDDGSPATPPPPAQPAASKPNPFLSEDGSPAPAAKPADTGQAGPDILPAGSDLLSASERESALPEPVVVETSHLSASEPGDVLEEKLPVAELDLDLSAYVLDELGADILAEDEKWHFEELEIDLSAIDLAAPGTDVLTEEERPPLPVVEVAEQDWDISPAGSDLGEIEKDAPPPPPSTDHLSLG